MTTKNRSKTISKRRKQPTPTAEFKALVSSLRGSMSWLKVTVDDYLREKHAETDAENCTCSFVEI